MNLLKRLKSKLRETYRFIIVHNETYEQAGNYTFTLGKLVLSLFLGAGFLVMFTALLIIFTPLREFIPGYTDSKMQEDHIVLMQDMERLKQQVALQDSFVLLMQGIFQAPVHDSLLFMASALIDEDSLGTSGPSGSAQQIRFKRPIKGNLIKKFEPDNKHYGIDLSVVNNASVYATADGTVLFAEYSKDTGYVMILKHADSYVSVYKHNNRLLKETGDFVFAGEAIATAGNTGELSTGPHLHFEIWHNGKPRDPLNYVSF